MSWFSVIKGLLSLAGHIAKYISDRQLLDAGADQEKLKQAEKIIEQIKKTDNAINNAINDIDIAGKLRTRYKLDK